MTVPRVHALPNVRRSPRLQGFDCSTAEYFMGVKNEGWRRVPNRLWQRSYYGRVIRSEQELVEIRAYIESNPGARYESQR